MPIANKAGKLLSKIGVPQRYLWVLDAGHGGVNDSGVYQTAGKRAYFKDGLLMDVKNLGVRYCEENCDDKYYEGEGNRQIIKKVGDALDLLGIGYEFTVEPDESHDVKLSARTNFFNLLKSPDKEKVFLSNHSDGFGIESANGHTVYTYTGWSESDEMATVFHQEAKLMFPDETFRTDSRDGDPDKESQFWVLKHTKGNAILLENFFHTNPSNFYNILGTEEGQNKIVKYIVNSIIRIEKYGINGKK